MITTVAYPRKEIRRGCKGSRDIAHYKQVVEFGLLKHRSCHKSILRADEAGHPQSPKGGFQGFVFQQ